MTNKMLCVKTLTFREMKGRIAGQDSAPDHYCHIVDSTLDVW